MKRCGNADFEYTDSLREGWKQAAVQRGQPDGAKNNLDWKEISMRRHAHPRPTAELSKAKKF